MYLIDAMQFSLRVDAPRKKERNNRLEDKLLASTQWRNVDKADFKSRDFGRSYIRNNTTLGYQGLT